MDQYLRLYVEDTDVVLISNSGRCTEAALEALQRHPEVAAAQVDDPSGMSDYTLPLNNPAAPDDEPAHELFRYRIQPATESGANQLAAKLEAELQPLLRGFGCEVHWVEG